VLISDFPWFSLKLKITCWWETSQCKGAAGWLLLRHPQVSILLKNDFPFFNSILKVSITMVLLETPTNHSQSLYILIFGDWNIYPSIIIMLLQPTSKLVWGLLTSEKRFSWSKNTLKVNITIVWLEKSSNHHQSLCILFFGD